jgi:hypothetical protein
MTLETGLDAATFLGILLLAVPVWSLNRRKRALATLPKAATADSGADATPGALAAGQLMGDIRSGATAWVNDWRPLDHRCLVGGYALLLGSSFLRIFV